ncbi:MAG: D-alanine--D-alanine ligase [Candidatus Omnitrophota bacterium]
MPLLVGLTYDIRSAPPKHAPKDACAEHDSPETISSVEEALKSAGHRVGRIGGSNELLKKFRRLKYDIVFNIAEGISGRNRESEVPILLDLAGIPYTGPDALALAVALDKSAAKKIFRYHGIPTPRYFMAAKADGIAFSGEMEFPVIVKPAYEGSAKGIWADSVVKDMRSLKEKAAYVIRTYKQPALIEEFVEGWEFTAGVIGNTRVSVLPVVERHVCAKSGLSSHVLEKCGHAAPNAGYRKLLGVDPALEARIGALAAEAFRALEFRDFARFDFRVSARGKRIFILEANPLPSLSKDDYFSMVAELQGLSYADMINRMFGAAIERCGLK